MKNTNKAKNVAMLAIEVWLDNEVITPQDLINLANQKMYPGCLQITKENLPNIEVGMFWYTDDTVSSELVDKRIKSIVLHVAENEVIGDTFEEANVVGVDAPRYIATFESEYIKKGEASYLSFAEMQSVQRNKTYINSSLSQLDKKMWRGVYMTSTDETKSHMRLVEIRSGMKHLAPKTSEGILRPVFRFKV